MHPRNVPESEDCIASNIFMGMKSQAKANILRLFLIVRIKGSRKHCARQFARGIAQNGILYLCSA